MEVVANPSKGESLTGPGDRISSVADRCRRCAPHCLRRSPGDQRRWRNPNLPIEEPFHGSLFVVDLNDVERRTRRFSNPGDPRSSSRGVPSGHDSLT